MDLPPPATLSDRVRRFLEAQLYPVIGTNGSDGEPHQAVIWFRLEPLPAGRSRVPTLLVRRRDAPPLAALDAFVALLRREGLPSGGGSRAPHRKPPGPG